MTVDLLAPVKKNVMQLLARREHSRRELQTKLWQKKFDSANVEQVLDWVMQQGFQSDERFAKAYTRMRVGRGFGPARIAAELRERGVEDELVLSVLNAYDGSWHDLALQVYGKKFGAKKKPHGALVYAQQVRFLLYRGFSIELAKKIIAAPAAEIDCDYSP